MCNLYKKILRVIGTLMFFNILSPFPFTPLYGILEKTLSFPKVFSSLVSIFTARGIKTMVAT